MKNANARNGHIAIFTAAVIILCGTILCALNNSMFLPVCDCSISTAELITDNGTFLEEQPVLQTSFTAKNYSRHCPRKNAVLVYPVVLMRYRKVRQSYSQSQNHIPYFFAILTPGNPVRAGPVILPNLSISRNYVTQGAVNV